MTLKVTYISHATVLIDWDGATILTDPVFSKRILFCSRKQPLKYNPAHLPKLDAILLSHAHYDHLDHFSFKYITRDPYIIVPSGMVKAVSPYISNHVVELDTWSRFSLPGGIDICAVPAKHPGGRLLFPLRYRNCNGYILSKGQESIYFSGDTTDMEDFYNIKRLFNPKLAILDAACPRQNWFTKKRHMDVAGLLRCWEILGKPVMIPIHWGTFFEWGDSHKVPKMLLKHAELDPTLKDKLHILEQGETKEF